MSQSDFYCRVSENRWWRSEKLQYFKLDYGYCILLNENRNVMFLGTQWLFSKCLEKGWFIEAQG